MNWQKYAEDFIFHNPEHARYLPFFDLLAGRKLDVTLPASVQAVATEISIGKPGLKNLNLNLGNEFLVSHHAGLSQLTNKEKIVPELVLKKDCVCGHSVDDHLLGKCFARIPWEDESCPCLLFEVKK